VARNRRFLLLVAAVVVAALVVGSVVAIGAGRGDSTPGTTTRAKSPAAAASSPASAVLAGVPQDGLTLGKPTAPATLLEFVDPQCPYCARWSEATFPVVVRRFVKTGRLRLELRGLHFLGPDSETALRAVLAAAQQNKAWNMLDELYARQGAENSGWVTDAVLEEAATAAGVDVAKTRAAHDSPRVTAQILEADAAASTLGIPGTPSFALARPPATPQLLTIPSLEPADFAASLESDLDR